MFQTLRNPLRLYKGISEQNVSLAWCHARQRAHQRPPVEEDRCLIEWWLIRTPTRPCRHPFLLYRIFQREDNSWNDSARLCLQDIYVAGFACKNFSSENNNKGGVTDIGELFVHPDFAAHSEFKI